MVDVPRKAWNQERIEGPDQTCSSADVVRNQTSDWANDRDDR
jgi:regulation of enolase protein 1 (concanavalin A-like superfamily)